MSVDLTKLTVYTPDNAFKNVNRYTGSIVFPTSVGAGATVTVTSTIILTDSPVFTDFFANFLEETDATGLYGTGAGTAPKKWYTQNVAGNNNIGLHTTAPVITWIGGLLYPVINGSTVTITGSVFNPFGSTATIDSVTVPYVFVEYTLAN